ncbi:MAG TPA: hypothetical protein PLL66_06270 [Bacteroidales bacterium]|nr:hypothetical protein [Bacteroidales bacterium]
MKRFASYIFIFIVFIPVVFSQSKEISNLIASADKAFEEKNYYGAALLYEDALKFNQRMYDIIWKAAESYRFDNDYVRAAIHYRYLADKVSEKYPEAFFYYALMLKANEEFMKAQYFFKRYIEFNELDNSSILYKRAEEELVNCEFAWKMFNHPNGYDVIQCDSLVNSVFSDFSTGFVNDSLLVFASIKPIQDSIHDYKSRLYQYNFFDENTDSAQLFSEVINIQGYDISNPHFTKSGNRLYFTISDYFDGGNTYIYMSEFVDNQWTKPEKLPEIINKPRCNSTHPYLVEREDKTDIFLWSSDRPEGEGGYDIYFCEILPDGNWGFARNVGRPVFDDTRYLNFFDTTSVINSPGDEITPFYNPVDSLLYFSSNWHKNMGGYDIFKVKGNFRVWDTIENIGYPLNSAQNDFYYRIYPDQYVAFLASNRKSALAHSHQSCCNDIYYHDIAKEINEEVVEVQRVELLTERTKLLVPIALYFHNDEPVPNSWNTVTELNYSTTYFKYMELQEDYRKNYSKGLSKNEKIEAIDSVDYYFSYYVQENYNKLLEFTSLMKELLAEGQKIVVTIKGYTSPLNTVEYNNNLAKRRISSLVNYFAEFEGGIFLPYIESGMIVYEFVAFGKTFSAGKVSDDPNDPRNSIYSPAASRERRIEIIAVSVVSVEQSE